MSNRFFYYHEKRKLIKIDLHDVLYLEASGNYTRFREQNLIYTVRVSLERALKILPEDAFFRISKSYALSNYKVMEFDKTSAWFKKGGDPDLEYRPSNQPGPPLLRNIGLQEQFRIQLRHINSKLIFMTV